MDAKTKESESRCSVSKCPALIHAGHLITAKIDGLKGHHCITQTEHRAPNDCAVCMYSKIYGGQKQVSFVRHLPASPWQVIPNYQTHRQYTHQ
jgi:hypothetical protein